MQKAGFLMTRLIYYDCLVYTFNIAYSDVSCTLSESDKDVKLKWSQLLPTFYVDGCAVMFWSMF